jgi:vacuolar-type H+-ATPase subunit C/Vma6
MAEGSRLDELCRLRSVPELVHAIAPESPAETVVGLQRRMVSDLAKELAVMADRLGGAAGRVVEWLGARFQAENIKVLARGLATGKPLAETQAFIIPLKEPFAIDLEGLAGADSLEAFIGRVPSEPLRDGLRVAAPLYEHNRKSFFLEAGIDKGYLVELMERAGRVRQGEGLQALAHQETDMFHLALAARGRLLYGLKAEVLAPFHVEGAKVDPEVFGAMLAATSAGELAALAATRVIDPLPALKAAEAREALTPAALEALALNRFHRMADRLFRRTPVGLDAVAAYVALKHIELANLITLSEGIRACHGVALASRAAAAPEAIRRRLIPRQAIGASGV